MSDRNDREPMTREQRIAYGKERAAEKADQLRATAEQKRASDRDAIRSMSDDELAAELQTVSRSDEIGYLGPDKTPHEWRQARDAARTLVIEAAVRRETVTYNAIKAAAYRETGLLVGWSMFGRLCMELNGPTEPVLLSSLVVGSDTGSPGDGFAEYARSRGFDAPLTTLQRETWDYFSSPA